MKALYYKFRKQIIVLLSFTFLNFAGCDIFSGDGVTDPSALSGKGFFYIADRASNSLIMLDYSMKELKRWSLAAIAPDSIALNGVTIDAANIWLSFSGNEKFIVQVDATGDNLIVMHTIPVPPVVNGTVQGTVRGIAFDGTYLWAVNSGSPTYTVSPTLFKISIVTDSVVASYPIPTPSPRGITYANLQPDAYGSGAAAGLYYLDNDDKLVHYFNTKVPLFTTAFTAPVPPAGTTWDQTLGITNDGENFYTLSYSTIGSYLSKCSYNGYTQFQYRLPYGYPVSVVWSLYDIRTIEPPVVTTITPSFATLGTDLTVTVKGTGFRNGAGLNLDFGPGVTVDLLSYFSKNLLTAHLTIDANAVTGKRTVKITNPDGKFTVSDSIFTVSPVPVVEYLFVTDVNYDSLYQIRISDSTVVKSWSTKTVSPSHPHGIAFDGTNFWMSFSSSDYKIYKVDMSGATLLGLSSFSTPANSGTVQNLTYNNGALWLLQTPPAEPARGILYKINPADGSLLDTITNPGILGGRGMCFANGLLYCNDRDSAKIYKCDPAVKNWTFAFPSPPPPGGSTSATGMYFTGTSFWIANSGGTNAASDLLYEVSLTGTVLRYITAPYAGAAKPVGVLYYVK